MGATAEIELSIEEIYSHSMVGVRATANRAFTLEVPGCSVFKVAYGSRIASDAIRSARFEDHFEVQATVVGGFAHLPVRGGALRYGMAPGVGRDEYSVRYFPFASSQLRLTLRVPQGRISALAVSDAMRIRALWGGRALLDEAGTPLPRQHAHVSGGWHGSLGWLPPERQPSVVTVELPVRTSGRALSKVLLFPLFTWLTSLIGIALAAELASTEVVVAAIGAAWAFILREWIASERAHQFNILTVVFIAEGVGAVVWGVAMIVGSWLPVAVAAVFAALVVDLVRVATRFEYVGRLPRRMAIPWAAVARGLERRRARRRTAMSISAFDHEQPSSGLT